MKKICMIVQNPAVKGGIASVVNGYRGSRLERDFNILYVESYQDGSKFEKLCKGIQGYIHFAKVLLTDKPDLVHMHSSFGASFWRSLPFIYMAHLSKIPIVNHIHGADFDTFYTKAGDRKKKIIKRAYSKCSKMIALSDEWKELLSNIVPAEKIEVIVNYSILHEDAYLEKNKRLCNNQVLFLGELGRRKGCYDIPAVVKEVARVIPAVRFVLCGSGTESDIKAIEQLVHENGVDGNVVFPGWVRDTAKDVALRTADLFFLPSYREGMPMSILDAMGYGLPVVSTNIGGIPNIVRDGRNGACCEPGDIDSFAKNIIDFLLCDKKRIAASQQSIQIVKERYTLEKHLDVLEQLYGSLIK